MNKKKIFVLSIILFISLNSLLISYGQNQRVIIVKNLENKKSIFKISNSEKKIEILEISEEEDLKQKIDILQNDPDILYVEEDVIRNKTYLINDPYSSEQWYLDKLDFNNYIFESRNQKEEIIIAVLDTGIDMKHQDLRDNILPGKNVAGTDSYMDYDGHGTNISGIIAADYNNNLGITGVKGGFEINVLPIKIADENGMIYTSNVAKGIDYAIERNVDIITLSIGSSQYVRYEHDAIKRAVDNGIIVLASAGNEYEEGNQIQYPASYPEVLSIGSVDKYYNRSYFSEVNDMVDFVSFGEDIFTADILNSYKYVDGTSFSTPIAATAFGIVKSIYPDLSNEEIKEAFIESCLDLGYPGKDEFYGYGLINISGAIEYLKEDILVESISFENEKQYMFLDDLKNIKLEYIIKPLDATNKGVRFFLEKSNIAIISSDGIIEPLNTGTAEIGVITDDQNLVDTIQLNIYKNDDHMFTEIKEIYENLHYEEAIEKLNILLSRDVKKEYYYYLGLCLEKEFKEKEAIETYQKAIDIDQNYLDAITAKNQLLGVKLKNNNYIFELSEKYLLELEKFENDTIKFISNDESIVRVNEEGFVYPIKEGKTTILINDNIMKVEVIKLKQWREYSFRENVPKDKVFTVKLNNKIDYIFSNDNNVYVLDEEQKIFPVEISTYENYIKVTPKNFYESGCVYSLYISSRLKDKKGNNLKEAVFMNFQVQ